MRPLLLGSLVKVRIKKTNHVAPEELVSSDFKKNAPPKPAGLVITSSFFFYSSRPFCRKLFVYKNRAPEGGPGNYSTSSKKALVARCTEREICKHDPSKKVAEMRSSDSPVLDPNWVTGFVDGEGCCLLTIRTDKRLKTGWAVEPGFSLGLHVKDKPLLEKIQKQLGVGKIYKHGPRGYIFQVRTFKDLNTLIKHFDSYPLKTKKFTDFKGLKIIMMKFKNKEHLTPEGLRDIVAIRAAMNWGLSEKLKMAFPYVVPVERPEVELPLINHPEWLAGFTSAEGCFKIVVTPAKTKVGYAVSLVFVLTQHEREEYLLFAIKEYLNCGWVRKYKQRDALDLIVSKFDDIIKKIIPFFQKHKIRGVKAQDFCDWCEAALIIEAKKHLTIEGLELIRKIKAGMNKGRKI